MKNNKNPQNNYEQKQAYAKMVLKKRRVGKLKNIREVYRQERLARKAQKIALMKLLREKSR